MSQEIATLRQAIAGITQMIAGRGLRVTQQGTQAFVEKDPKTNKPIRVNIPSLPDNASPELVMAIQGFIDHECGHILDTDYEVWAKAERRTRDKPGFFNCWNILEDTFIEAAMRRRFPGAHFNLDRLHEFFVKEITEVGLAKAGSDHKLIFNYLIVPMCRAWAGQPVFERFMLDKWHLVADEVTKIGALKDRVAKIRSSEDSYALADAFWDVLYAKPAAPAKPPAPAPKPKAPPAPKKAPEPEPMPGAEPEEEDEGTGAPGHAEEPEEGEGTTATASDDAEDEGAPVAPPAAAGPEEDDEEPSEADEEVETDELEDDAPGPSLAPEEAIDDPMSGDDDEGGEGAAPSEGSWTEEDQANHLEVEIDDGPGSLDEDDGSEGGMPDKSLGPTPLIDASVSGFSEALCERIGAEALEDTKACDYRVFTKDADRIEPYKVSKGYQDEFLTRLEDQTRQMVGVMQKDIERLVAARSHVVRVGGYRSGRLRAGALHRLAVQDDRVFDRKHQARSKNVALTLLVDCSGSMGGSKIATAMSAAYALSATLERVGIKHEVVGFTTGWSWSSARAKTEAAEIEEEQKRIGKSFSRVEPLWMPVFKAVEERLTPEVKRRFADFAPNGERRNNVDGECVELCAQRLRARAADRRVLIVLSDGEPSCFGNTWELERHLKRVVKDAEASGIETIGIGIQDDSVRKFYPKSFVISRVEELPPKVMGELRDILATA